MAFGSLTSTPHLDDRAGHVEPRPGARITKGHGLFAAAAAEALGLPGSNHDWAEVNGARPKSVAAVAGVFAGVVDTEHADAVALVSRAGQVGG